MKKKFLIFIFFSLITNTLCVAQDFCRIENDYAYFVENEKAKGVNFKIRIPEGWNVNEGSRPNVVARIENDFRVFMIMVKENYTFISRNQAKEIYATEEFDESYLFDRDIDSKIISSEIGRIDSYPVKITTFTYKQHLPQLQTPTTVIGVSFFMFYEDYLIEMRGITFDKELLECILPEGVTSEEIIEDAIVKFYGIAHSFVLFDHYK